MMCLTWTSQPRLPREEEEENDSTGVLRIATVFVVMAKRFDKVEAKVDRLEARLSLLVESSSMMRAIMHCIGSRLGQRILHNVKLLSYYYRYFLC